MATPKDQALMVTLHQATGVRVRLRPWESVLMYRETDTALAVKIETFDVKIMAREDRYNARGIRGLLFTKNPAGRWKCEFDETVWDETFVPYIYETRGRRKTADEFTEQREWEKLCHRPGSSKMPLDSYGRVLQGDVTKKMERHF